MMGASTLRVKIGSDPPAMITFTRRRDGLRVFDYQGNYQTYQFSEYGQGWLAHELTGRSWIWCYFTVRMNARSMHMEEASRSGACIHLNDSTFPYHITSLSSHWHHYGARYYIRLEGRNS